MNETPRGRLSELTLSLLRFVSGFLFFFHGAQKLLGWPAAPPSPMAPPRTPPAFPELPWFAGVLELIGGPCIALGLFTRPIAFLLSGEMAFAYFMAHAPQNFWPIINRGELAIVYCFLFLFFAANGGGRYGIEYLWRKRTP